MRVAAITLMMCACGDNLTVRDDASVHVRDDASADAETGDAPIGFKVSGAATGVRSAIVLTLTTETDTRHAAVNGDGAFTFPGGMPSGANYTVSAPLDSACEVLAGSGTITADVTTVELLCAGIVELASVEFASGAPGVPFISELTPAFAPGAYTYSGTRPFFMDDTDMISVTPVAAYPTLPSIRVYTDPTSSGQASPPHALGTGVDVRLQHPMAFDQAYRFALDPGQPTETALVKAPSPIGGDSFGTVALSKDVLVVGDPAHGSAGTIYVRRRSGTSWTQEQLLQPTADPGAYAGTSVAIDGDVLVVGAPADATDDSGRAYVYRFNTTSQTWVLDGGGTLAASNPSTGASCGTSVAISGPRVIMGCPGEKGNGNATNAGAVYMFRYDATSSTWVSDGTFKGATANDSLGAAVALSGTSAIVGAPYEDDGATVEAGGAHILLRGTSSWSQQGTTLRGAAAAAHLGFAVALSGDYAVAGAPDAAAGAAYLFRRVGTAWSPDGVKTGVTTIGADLAKFGRSVAIDGTHLVVGAPRADLAIVDGGAVYAYRREVAGWTTSRTVTPTATTTTNFGTSVTVDGEWFVVGAPDEDSIAASSGAAHVFR